MARAAPDIPEGMWGIHGRFADGGSRIPGGCRFRKPRLWVLGPQHSWSYTPGTDTGAECVTELERATRQDAHPVEGEYHARPGRNQPRIVGVGVIQVAPQMRILVAIEA